MWSIKYFELQSYVFVWCGISCVWNGMGKGQCKRCRGVIMNGCLANNINEDKILTLMAPNVDPALEISTEYH